MAAEAAVGFVVEAFGNLLIEEAKFLPAASDQVEDLQPELDRLRSYEMQKQGKMIRERDIQVWISQSRDLADEAEDLFEEYAFRIASQRGNILKRTVCCLKECHVRSLEEMQEMKVLGKEMVKSFGGVLPLAVVVPGGILSNTLI